MPTYYTEQGALKYFLDFLEAHSPTEWMERWIGEFCTCVLTALASDNPTKAEQEAFRDTLLEALSFLEKQQLQNEVRLPDLLRRVIDEPDLRDDLVLTALRNCETVCEERVRAA